MNLRDCTPQTVYRGAYYWLVWLVWLGVMLPMENSAVKQKTSLLGRILAIFLASVEKNTGTVKEGCLNFFRQIHDQIGCHTYRSEVQ